eukprot:ctg_227.g118
MVGKLSVQYVVVGIELAHGRPGEGVLGSGERKRSASSGAWRVRRPAPARTRGHTGRGAGENVGREGRGGGWRRRQGGEYVRGEKDVAVVGAVCPQRSGGRHRRCVPHATVAVERARRDNVERSATRAVDGSVVSVTRGATAAVERAAPGVRSRSASGSASVASVVARGAAVARVCVVDAGDSGGGTAGIRVMPGNISGAGAGRGSCVVPRRRAVHSWRSTIVDWWRPWRQRPPVRRCVVTAMTISTGCFVAVTASRSLRRILLVYYPVHTGPPCLHKAHRP